MYNSSDIQIKNHEKKTYSVNSGLGSQVTATFSPENIACSAKEGMSAFALGIYNHNKTGRMIFSELKLQTAGACLLRLSVREVVDFYTQKLLIVAS